MGEKLQFTALDQYLFGQGTHYDIYRKLGAHPVKQGKKEGVYFAVWAPNAQAVSVIGEFNDWNEQAAKVAESYINHSSFSRSGLIDQLQYEGFTKDQAEYGATAVGY